MTTLPAAAAGYFYPVTNYTPPSSEHCPLCNEPAKAENSLVEHVQQAKPRHWMHRSCALKASQSAIEEKTTLTCVYCMQQMHPISAATAQERDLIKQSKANYSSVFEEIRNWKTEHLLQIVGGRTIDRINHLPLVQQIAVKALIILSMFALVERSLKDIDRNAAQTTDNRYLLLLPTIFKITWRCMTSVYTLQIVSKPDLILRSLEWMDQSLNRLPKTLGAATKVICIASLHLMPLMSLIAAAAEIHDASKTS